MGRTYEVSTVGIDDGLQGFTSDPFGSAFPSSVGLRVPAFIPNNSDPKLNRYLFLLASVRVGRGTSVRVREWRQYVTIGINAATTGTIVRPVEFEVTTAGFRFPDGNISWHLVREPPQGVPTKRPATDQVNLAFQSAEQPALLYDTVTYGAGGNGGFYMVNMTGYTAPFGRYGTWEPIAGLGNVHDLRASWLSTDAWANSLDVVVPGEARVSLYASVLQTNPTTRPVSNAPAVQSVGDPPEENFITKWNGQGPGGAEGGGVHYWRVAGALILEDC